MKDYASIDPLAAAQKEIDDSIASATSVAPPPIDAPPPPVHEPLIDVPPAASLSEPVAPDKPRGGAS